MYSITMEPTPLEEFTFSQIYTIFHDLMEDDFLDIEAVETGPVTYYNFTVYGDHIVHYQAELEAFVQRGIHSLIRDPRTDEWVAYQAPKED